MIRVVAVAALVVLALPPLGAQDQPPPPGQVFRSAVDFVRVDAYPRRDGRLVEGLTIEDFAIVEDGQLQTIDTFEFVRHAPEAGYDRLDPRNRAEAERWVADPRRRLFIVYLDLYHISRAAATLIRGPLMEVLSESIGPSDVVAVMTPETPIGELAFTQTLNTLAAEIEHYWAGGLLDAPVSPRTPAEQQLTSCGNAMSGFDRVIRDFRDAVFFTSLESLVANLGALRQDRTNVILLSEGWRNRSGGIRVFGAAGRTDDGSVRFASQFGRPGIDQFGRPSSDQPGAQPVHCGNLLARLEIDYQDRFRRLFEAANANNVSFHTIDVGGLRTRMANAESRRPGRVGGVFESQVLQELAENTDGLWTTNQNDISAGLRRVVELTSSYYLLGYASTNTASDGGYRRIEVRVEQRGVDVTARRGYFGVSSEMQQRNDERTARAAVASPIAAAFGELARWDNSDDVMAVATASPEAISVRAELTARELSTGRWREGGNVFAEIVDATGRTTTVDDRLEAGRPSFRLEVPVDPAAGPWRLYLRVTNEAAEVSTRLDIDPVGDTRLGDARFFRIPAIGRPTPQPVVAPVFRRGERMRLEWQTSQPPTATIDLLDRRGQILSPGAALSHAFDASTGTFWVELHIAALAEGDYAIDVRTGDDDANERQIVAFRVGR